MWQELYRLVFRYLTNLGLIHEDAEDLAQETLASAYLHLDGVQEGKLKIWLFTVARHKYIDWLRRNKKGVVLVSIFNDELIDGSENPEEVVLDMEKRKEILTAIESLNNTERNLLIMKYSLDLSNREIGKILKMKPNTVKVSLYRARKKFKAAYQKLREVKL